MWENDSHVNEEGRQSGDIFSGPNKDRMHVFADGLHPGPNMC